MASAARVRRAAGRSAITPTIVVLIDASYALAVAGAALLWPPLALLVAAGYLGMQAYLSDRRRLTEG